MSVRASIEIHFVKQDPVDIVVIINKFRLDI